MKLLLLGIAIILFGIALTLVSSGVYIGFWISLFGLLVSAAGAVKPDKK